MPLASDASPVCSHARCFCTAGGDLAAHPGPPEALEEQRCGANEPRSQWSGGWQGLVAAEPQKELTSVLLRFSRRRAADGPPGPAHKRASKINRLQKSIWPVKSSLVSFTFINASLSLSAAFTLPSTPHCSAGTRQAPGLGGSVHSRKGS